MSPPTPSHSYPPAPWSLRGTMCASLWRVPAAHLPRWPLPDGTRPWVLGGRCTLVTVWADYRRGGTLAYHELLLALAVRDGRGIAAHAALAWVDDERSLAGGRELWGVPKQLAAFSFRPTTVTARLAPTEGTVTARYADVLRLPGRLVVPARLVQRRDDGRVCRVPLRLTGTAWLGRGSLAAEPAGPLGFLAGRRPTLTLALRDLRFRVDERQR